MARLVTPLGPASLDYNSALSPSSRTNAFPHIRVTDSTLANRAFLFPPSFFHLQSSIHTSSISILHDACIFRGQKWLISLVIGPSSSAGSVPNSARRPFRSRNLGSNSGIQPGVSGSANSVTTRRRRCPCIGDVSSRFTRDCPGGAMASDKSVIKMSHPPRPRPRRACPIYRSIVSRTFSSSYQSCPRSPSIPILSYSKGRRMEMEMARRNREMDGSIDLINIK